MALYISDGVGVNSIEDVWPIPAGWATITEAEAKAMSPELFGIDPEAAPVAPATKATK